MRYLLLSLFISCLMATPVQANERELVLSEVEIYLEKLTTLKADFVQIAPGGDLVSGVFYLKRPGKMRWQYDPPVPVVMVGNGKFLRYWDRELDQISDIPLDDTLAGFLAKRDISFDPKVVKVLEASSRDKVLRVKIEMANKPHDGSLTMEFEEGPLKLRNLILVDAEGKQTNISLNNAKYGISLPDDLFVIKDTRLGGKGRR